MKKSLLITGSNGWFGKAFANNLELFKKDFDEIIFLVRKKPGPHLKNLDKNYIKIFKQDLNKKIQIDIDFSHCIHMATPDSKLSKYQMKKEMLLQTKNIIQFCNKKKINKFLYLSSGAVYGEFKKKAKEDNLNINSLDNMQNYDGYQLGKIECEKYLLNEKDNLNFKFLIARCFTFIGPNMPLIGFAVPNIIEQIIKHKEVTIQSNVIRSYLHENDLICNFRQLLLIENKFDIYNIGSDKEISLLELSSKIFKILKIKKSIKFKNIIAKKRTFYVPNNDRIKKEIECMENLKLVDTVKSIRNQIKI